MMSWTAEGEVMGVRHRSLALEGVQFHPESILTPDGPRLLAAFLVTSLPLGALRWLVVVVVIYTATMMLRSAHSERTAVRAGEAGGGRPVV